MRKFTSYQALPPSARYLGHEQPDGTMSEKLDDIINEAIEPVFILDADGSRGFFDLHNIG